MQLRTLFFLQIDEHWAKWFVPLALSVCMFVFVLRRGLRKRESRWGVKGGGRGEVERQEERGGRRECGGGKIWGSGDREVEMKREGERSERWRGRERERGVRGGDEERGREE